MSMAKDRVGAPPPGVLLWLGLGLCFLDLGCAGMGGLRSIGLDPASLLHFRDRGPGSPAPENDLYAQAMQGPRGGTTGSVSPADKPATKTADHNTPTDPGDQPVDGAAPRLSRHRSASGSDDREIQVSLGQPQPLPALERAARSEQLASTSGSVPWRVEGNNRSPDALRGLSGPADREEDDLNSAPSLAEQPGRADVADAKALFAQAEAKLSALTTYQVQITRQERVNGQLQPEEDILVSIKRNPRAVRLEWSNGPNRGREVIYSSTVDPSNIFVHQPATAILVPSVKIPVNSPLVTQNSRHSITEAGFDTILENLHGSKAAAGEKRSEHSELVYMGMETPPGLTGESHHFVRQSVSGETWNVYLDSQSLLPRLVVAYDSRGSLIERYAYREIRENPAELASASAFEPEQRWGDSKGFLSRLARAAAGSSVPTTTGSTTR
jgi:hypothetical protein